MKQTLEIQVFLISKKKPVKIEIETKYPANYTLDLATKLESNQVLKIGNLIFRTNDISHIIAI